MRSFYSYLKLTRLINLILWLLNLLLIFIERSWITLLVFFFIFFFKLPQYFVQCLLTAFTAVLLGRLNIWHFCFGSVTLFDSDRLYAARYANQSSEVAFRWKDRGAQKQFTSTSTSTHAHCSSGTQLHGH